MTPTPAPDFLKVITFTVASQPLALPLAQGKDSPFPVVQRVIHSPVSLNHHPLQLLHWEDQDVIILNLHSLSTPAQAIPPFLILVQTPNQECYGIPVSDPPSLLELPLATIRPLPPSYAQRDPLGMASYIAVLPQSGDPLILFLLDLNRALQVLSQPPTPPSGLSPAAGSPPTRDPFLL
ncbi:MAG: hypothetical protein NW237_15315 [Cyanobacteriota bacterium]|nr:hypothetical protein [Cyanobacteriota bacterium]